MLVFAGWGPSAPFPPSSIAQPPKNPMARLGQPPLVPLPTPDNPSWSPHPPRTTQLGPLLTYLLYAMLLLVTSRNVNYLNMKLSRNFWLETFQKLLVGSFYYWLETSRNFWEVLKTFQKLLLETFQKLKNFWKLYKKLFICEDRQHSTNIYLYK